MDWKNCLFAQNDHLDIICMGLRSILAYLVALVLLRLAGLRTFGNKTSFDWVIMIMMGAVLSRGVVGANDFLPVIASCFILVVIHRVLGWLTYYSPQFGKLVKGEKMSLYAESKENKKNMKAAMISTEDMEEGIRLQINKNSFDSAEEIFIERTGEISVIEKE